MTVIGTFTIDPTVSADASGYRYLAMPQHAIGTINVQFDDHSIVGPILEIDAGPISFFGITSNSYAWLLTAPEFSGGFLTDVPSTSILPLPFNNYQINHFGGDGFTIDLDSLTLSDASTFTFTAHLAGPVPEPATWALLLFGFAFFGLRQLWPGASHE